MANALKDQFGPATIKSIAQMIKSNYSDFNSKDFYANCIDGFEELGLIARGQKIALGLRFYLPKNFNQAANIILSCLGPKLKQTYNNGMAPFLYLPFTQYTASYGIDYFETAMTLQYELTQRFTAEFSIREFLKKYPEQTLNKLSSWTEDSNVHVRRLVSEGTRPRLPWGCRLTQFQKDPRPVLALLERLKNDSEPYVLRSVANNLNDIGKDNPKLLYQTLKAWQQSKNQTQPSLIKHALRSAIKRAEPEALKLLGFNKLPEIKISRKTITPEIVTIGSAINISFFIKNLKKHNQALLIDLKVYYVKANNKLQGKVFKLKSGNLAAFEEIQISKQLSLKNMTTRRHYPGQHKLELIINGQTYLLGHFTLKTKP